MSINIMGKTYELGEAVIYSVYPAVNNGTGIVTVDGIKSTGATLEDVTAMGLGDLCEFEYLYDIKPLENSEMTYLETLAKELNGQVWDSGGGNVGVLVQQDGWEVFFAFADDVLGWDINDMPAWEYIGGGITDLTIEQMPEVIERCKAVIANKEVLIS